MTKRDGEEQKIRVNIREMNEGDIDGVLAVDRKITAQDRALTYSTVPESFLGGQIDMSVVAEIEDVIVGFLLGRVVDSPFDPVDIALIKVIGVDPACRRLHIGKMLVDAFMENCKKRGVDSVHAMVSVHDWWMLSFLRSLEFNAGKMVEFVKPLR